MSDEEEERCEMFHFADEFEEFRARSYSGGFLLLDWPQARTDKRCSLPNYDAETTSLHLANMTLEEVSSSEDEVDEDDRGQKHQSLLKSMARSSRSSERLFARRGDRISGSDSRLKDIAAAPAGCSPHRIGARRKEAMPKALDLASTTGAASTSAAATSPTAVDVCEMSGGERCPAMGPIAEPRSPMEGAKFDRSRHLSLKTSNKYGLSPCRTKLNPPAIHVSVHRQVASGAPPEWNLDGRREADEVDDNNDDDDDDDEWHLGNMRPRVFSLPDGPLCRPKLSTISASKESQLRRMRSFTITRKGLRKEYKEFPSPGACSCEWNARDQPLGSAPSPDAKSGSHSGDCGAAARFKVVLIGDPNVGKQTIIKRFVTERDMSFSFDDETEKSVSILLDGEESTMEFVDMSDRKVDEEVTSFHVDAYVVVYSVEDRRSFESAINRLYEIRETEGRHVALILVANKTDLVRSRAVQEEEGKAAANTYDSKYIEVSAAIDHKIDELLVGVLKQIRLIKKKYHNPKPGWKFGRDPGAFLDNCCLLQARENVLAKLFKGDIATSKSCDNLYVL